MALDDAMDYASKKAAEATEGSKELKDKMEQQKEARETQAEYQHEKSDDSAGD